MNKLKAIKIAGILGATLLVISFAFVVIFNYTSSNTSSNSSVANYNAMLDNNVDLSSKYAPTNSKEVYSSSYDVTKTPGELQLAQALKVVVDEANENRNIDTLNNSNKLQASKFNAMSPSNASAVY